QPRRQPAPVHQPRRRPPAAGPLQRPPRGHRVRAASGIISSIAPGAAMDVSARAASFEEIVRWRDLHRLEMACQITHDSIHTRPGWTEEYVLLLEGTGDGYGSVAVGGPCTGKPTVYEFFVVPHQPRLRAFELFQALLAASRAVAVKAQ